MSRINKKIFLPFLMLVLAGCVSSNSGNTGQLQYYNYAAKEATWITNGEPIQFEGDMWYPADGVESFLDSEMQLLGKYKDVEFFIDKQDVRPYNRLYTKFSRNQFRYFVKKAEEND